MSKNSNTTLVKVKQKTLRRIKLCLIIQIQLLLKLNKNGISRQAYFNAIQIQLLLKLNYGYGGKPNVGTGFKYNSC